MGEDREARALREAQLEREQAERKSAESALEEEEFAAHERRAEKASYLREKLEERLESEREQK